MATQNDTKHGVSADEDSPTISRQLVNVAQQILGASHLVLDRSQAQRLKEDLLLSIQTLTSITQELDKPQRPTTAQPSALLDAASQFERLPGELRNRIYKLVLRLDPGFHFQLPACEQHRHPYQGRKVVSEGLLRTRRGIYSEAVSILYSSNFIQIGKKTRSDQACKECWRIGHDALFISKRVQKFEHVEIITSIESVPVWISSSWPTYLSTWSNADIQDIMYCFTGLTTLWLTMLVYQDADAIEQLKRFVRNLLERGPPRTLGTISIQGRHSLSAVWEQHLWVACDKIVIEKQSAWTVVFCPVGQSANPPGVPSTTMLNRLPHNLSRVILQHRG